MTEHLPIQRWTKVFTRYPASEILPNENGEYVTYADHLAALRACERRMLDAAREAVAAIRDALNTHYRIVCEPPSKVDWSQHRKCDPVDEILAAIDALREEKP